MNICDVKVLFGAIATIFALAAAVLWFIASWRGRGSFSHDLSAEILRDLKIQSRFNAAAAFCAGVAAMLQIPLVYMPTCWG
jgi:hypothetical protein